MQFCIQDPTYENSMYLHETLLTECENSISGAGAYAFATKDGVELLLADESFKHFLKQGTYFLVIGMDDITNLRTLEMLTKIKEAHENHLTIKAYIHNINGSTFHPKYSWFKKETGGVLVLGSGNLTSQGLRHNREAFSVVSYEGQSFDAVIQEWDKWIEHSKPFLFDIDDDIVLQRAKQNSANIQAVYQLRKATGETSISGNNSALTELFKTQPKNITINQKLLGFNSTDSHQELENANTQVSKKTEDTILPVSDDFEANTTFWTISAENRLLIAEIPKSGNRWKQANFDKETFENFFGATCGENGAYRILLRNVNDDGSLGETEIRPSVSVASQNYRFELDAAAGVDYPDGDLRPIGLFVRVSQRDFLYELLLPNQQGYSEIVKLLDKTQPRSLKMRRLQYSCAEVNTKVPSLAIWKRTK